MYNAADAPEDAPEDAPDDACDASSEIDDTSIAGDYCDGDGMCEGVQKSQLEAEHMMSDDCESNKTHGNESVTVTTRTSGADTTDTDTIMASVPDASHASTANERTYASAAISSNEDEDASRDVTGSQNNYEHHGDESFHPPTTSVKTPEERLQRKKSSGAVSQEDIGHYSDFDVQTDSGGTDDPSSLHSRLVGSFQLASPLPSATDPPPRDTADEGAQRHQQQLDVGGTMITSTATIYQNGIFTRPGAYRIDPLPPAETAETNNGRGYTPSAFDDGGNNNGNGATPPPTRLRRSTNIPEGQNVSGASTASTSHHGSRSRSDELRPPEIHTDDNDHTAQAPVAVPVGESAPIEASLVIDPLHIVSVQDDGNGWKGQRRQKNRRVVALSVAVVAIFGIVLGVVLGNKKSNIVGSSNIDAQVSGSSNDQRSPLPVLDRYQLIPLPSPPVPTDEMKGRYFQQSIVKISAQGKRVIVASPQVLLGLKESSDFVGTTPSGSNGIVQVYDAVFQNTASNNDAIGGREIDEETAKPLRNENNEGTTSDNMPNGNIHESGKNKMKADDRGNAQSISEYREQYRFAGQRILGNGSFEAQTVPTQFGDAGDGIVGHALDVDDSGNAVAISFMQRFTYNHRLGSGPNPGLVRVFARNSTDNSWRQLGNAIEASGIHRFGASVGFSLSPMSGGRLIVGSEDGTARAYRRVGDLSTPSSWERVDDGLLDLERGRGSKVSVAMTTIGRRFVVGYPDSNLVRMYEFDDEHPNGPNIQQVGPDLKGNASDDGFGHSVSINLGGEFVVVGSKSGRYVQPFVLPRIGMEEVKGTRTIESWQPLPPIYSEQTDENGFGYSVSAGRANPKHTGPVKGRTYTPDGQRIIVGSPEFGDGRGRAIVYQFNSTDVTWYRLGKQAVGRDNFSRLGHSVSLSAQSMFVAASSGVGIASSQGEVQLFRLEETG